MLLMFWFFLNLIYATRLLILVAFISNTVWDLRWHIKFVER